MWRDASKMTFGLWDFIEEWDVAHSRKQTLGDIEELIFFHLGFKLVLRYS